MRNIFLCIFVFLSVTSLSQEITNPPDTVYPAPNSRQLKWMKSEMNAFVHFTTNTFTNLEWGYGDEKESVFNPTQANPEQWAQIIKETGFKGLIFTTKHHDGFCLWPSKFTEHSIKNSHYKNGNGDLVNEVSEACKKYGLNFGIYLSPWDRNRSDYGKPSYIDYYRNQLEELITNYGPIYELWFDGANGGTGYYGGANEKRRIDQNYYDWENTIKLARSLQNEEIIVFSDAGPDIRWVGNEQGFAGKTNWYNMDPDSCFIRRPGYEKILAQGMENGSNWLPSEVDVSIRPGWFYHESEDSLVKSPQELFEIYLKSVGRGAVLLLNIPPDRRGLINENDLQSLKGFRDLLDKEFSKNLMEDALIDVSSVRDKSKTYGPNNLNDNEPNTYWATNDDEDFGIITIKLKKKQEIKYLVLREYLNLGQRVKAFEVEVKNDNNWVKVADATTIGIKKIIKLDHVNSDEIRINITKAKACLTISGLELY